MFMRSFIVALVACLAWSNQVQAAVTTYDVSSTGRINCTGSPHGFWSNSMRAGGHGCGAYYDYQDGSTLTIDTHEGTAVLDATAINPAGHKVSIDFSWSGLTDRAGWTGMVKNGGGGDPNTWMFFGEGSGKINFFDPDMNPTGMANVMIVPDTALQVGWGADDKTSDFGGSSWLKYSYSGRGVDGATTTAWGGHWDFNMKLTARVPEPGTIAMLTLGLVGLTLQRRSKRYS